MYCRGHATRLKIIETYKLVPLGRFKLLNGQSVISDAGNCFNILLRTRSNLI